MDDAGFVVSCIRYGLSRHGEAVSRLGHAVKLHEPLMEEAFTTSPPNGPGGLTRLLGLTEREHVTLGLMLCDGFKDRDPLCDGFTLCDGATLFAGVAEGLDDREGEVAGSVADAESAAGERVEGADAEEDIAAAGGGGAGSDGVAAAAGASVADDVADFAAAAAAPPIATAFTDALSAPGCCREGGPRLPAAAAEDSGPAVRADEGAVEGIITSASATGTAAGAAALMEGDSTKGVGEPLLLIATAAAAIALFAANCCARFGLLLRVADRVPLMDSSADSSSSASAAEDGSTAGPTMAIAPSFGAADSSVPPDGTVGALGRLPTVFASVVSKPPVAAGSGETTVASDVLEPANGESSERPSAGFEPPTRDHK